MSTVPPREMDIDQQVTGPRSTVIGLAERVNIAYTLLPEATRHQPATEQAFQNINQLITQLNQQLKAAENEQLTRLLRLNIDRYVQRGSWALYALGLVAALAPGLKIPIILAVAVGLLVTGGFYIWLRVSYDQSSDKTHQVEQQVDAYLRQIDPRYSLAITRPYHTATRYPVLTASRRWLLFQTVFFTLGGFAVVLMLLPDFGIGFEGELSVTQIIIVPMIFVVLYSFLLYLVNYLRVRAERIKLDLSVEDHLFHLRYGSAPQSYVQVVDLESLLADMGAAPPPGPQPVFGMAGAPDSWAERTAEPAQPADSAPPSGGAQAD